MQNVAFSLRAYVKRQYYTISWSYRVVEFAVKVPWIYYIVELLFSAFATKSHG